MARARRCRTRPSPAPRSPRYALHTRADRGLELLRPVRADEHRDPLTQSELDADVPAGAERPPRGTEPHAPPAVIGQRAVPLHLETDDVAEGDPPRGPEITEGHDDSVVRDIGVEVREREQERDERDDTWTDQEQQRLIWRRRGHGDDGHDSDEEDHRDQDAEDSGRKPLLLVIAHQAAA